jgi:hypothetical protein
MSSPAICRALFPRRSLFHWRVCVTAASIAMGQGLLLCGARISSQTTGADRHGATALVFERNEGQADSSVRFVAHGSGYSLLLTGSEAILALRSASGCIAPGRQLAGKLVLCSAASSAEPDLVRMRLVNSTVKGRAANTARVTGEDELPGRANYFIGNDSSKWHVNVPTYAKVRYAGVYPGVDMIYYGSGNRLEYDFVVAPGADAKSIRIQIAGASPRIGPNGDLELKMPHGQAILHSPVAYQAENSGIRSEIHSSFMLSKRNEVAFLVGDYDRRRPLVIDPVLVYSSYLGGSSNDGAVAVAVDSAGSAYVFGDALSTDFPVTPGGYQRKPHGLPTTFVSKFNSSGTELEYSTYLGGALGSYAGGIFVDAHGDAFVAGNTDSRNFRVTPGAFQTEDPTPIDSYGGWGPAGFVSKLDPSGSGLIYSTYLGGQSNATYCQAITADADGNAYVAGATQAAYFPTTPGAFQTTFKGREGSNWGPNQDASNAFVTKLNPQGTGLIYSTFLGGSDGDQANAIAIDSSGDAYVTGYTFSWNFPVTEGAYQTVLHSHALHRGNAFITKFNADGSRLEFSTFLGGQGDPNSIPGDLGNAISVDSDGSVYVAGQAASPDFPTTPGTLNTVPFVIPTPYGSIFLARFNSRGTALDYSTFLGGGYASGLAVDREGNSYVAGMTLGDVFQQSPNAIGEVMAPPTAFFQAFVAKVNPTGTALRYGSVLGGT